MKKTLLILLALFAGHAGVLGSSEFMRHIELEAQIQGEWLAAEYYLAQPPADLQQAIKSMSFRTNDELGTGIDILTRQTISIHQYPSPINTINSRANSRQAKRDMKTRQHLSERSFAQSKRYGYKRARWRRLWRVKIQDFLIAALQNIQILISNSKSKAQSQVNALVGHLRPSSKRHILSIWPISCLKTIWGNMDSLSNSLGALAFGRSYIVKSIL